MPRYILAKIALSSSLALIAGVSFAQAGFQRIGTDSQSGGSQPVSPVAAPQFGAQPTQQQRPATPMPGSAMPQPMPAPKLDLVAESINMVAPLTPAEVLKLRKEMAARATAANQPLAPTAKPIMRVSHVDMGPGAVPELIRITMTEGATVSFMDAAGRPWKVVGADNFNPAGVDIGRSGDHGIVISSKALDTNGNISVRLEGLASPIALKVISGSGVREVDYSVDMQIPKFLPGSPAPVGNVQQQLGLGVDDLLNYLLKTPPKDARALTVDGLPGGLAWQANNGRIILRTNQMVIAPNWARRQSSFDGMTVYDLPTTPYVLVSADGQLSNVRINGIAVTLQ